MSMSEIAKWIAGVMILIGTLGLLANEFILDWGTIATLIFAALNVVGLIILAFANWEQ